MKKILIIDDDRILTSHYEDALVCQSFDVTICHGISEAFRQDLVSYDLIVCDLMMPDDGFFENIGTHNNLTTGLRFIEQVRSDGCKVPCVILTHLNIRPLWNHVEESLAELIDVIIIRKSEFNPMEFSEAALGLIDKTAFETQSEAFGRRVLDAITLKAPIIPGFLTVDLKKLFGLSDRPG